MPVLALVSAKGSPGVTTAAAALTAAASLVGDALLVELDPSGGDVQILTGIEEEPGIVLAATELRRHLSAGAVADHVSIAPPEVPALLAPTAELMAASVIASVIDRWRPALRQHGGTVVVDAGRWDAAQATARRVAVGDLVAVVCRPSVASVEHARHIVDRLRATSRRPVVALVVGTRPYAPVEVAAQLDVPLGGAVAWDPRGVGTLWAKGVSKSWGRTWLASSSAQSLESLLALVPDSIAQSPVTRTAGAGRRPLTPAETPAGTGPLTPAETPAGTGPLTPAETSAGTGRRPLTPAETPAGTPRAAVAAPQAPSVGADATERVVPRARAAAPQVTAPPATDREAHGAAPAGEPDATHGPPEVAGAGDPVAGDEADRPVASGADDAGTGAEPHDDRDGAPQAEAPEGPEPSGRPGADVPPPGDSPADLADATEREPGAPVPQPGQQPLFGAPPPPPPPPPPPGHDRPERPPAVQPAMAGGSTLGAESVPQQRIAPPESEPRVPATNFERFALTRARQRARNAGASALPGAEKASPGAATIAGASDLSNDGPSTDAVPGRGGLRRGRLNYGLARRDRS